MARFDSKRMILAQSPNSGRRRALVTGACGFLGSNLVDALLTHGWSVVGVDDLSTGIARFLESAKANPHFAFVERDLFDPRALDGVLDGGFERVFHLSANADVRFGLDHARKDLEQNTIVTWNVLEAMRRAGVEKLT